MSVVLVLQISLVVQQHHHRMYELIFRMGYTVVLVLQISLVVQQHHYRMYELIFRMGYTNIAARYVHIIYKPAWKLAARYVHIIYKPAWKYTVCAQDTTTDLPLVLTTYVIPLYQH